MATLPNRIVHSETTGKFRFEISRWSLNPVLIVEVKQRIKRFAPLNDEIERCVWEKATYQQAIEIQHIHNT